MKTRIVVLIIFTLMLGCLSENEVETEDIDDPKIVGGVNATPGQCKFIASLRDALDRHYCAASIISDRFLLTAGHCIDNDKDLPRSAVVGTISRIDTATMYAIEKRVIHKLYNKFIPLNNDIAIVKTIQPIVFNDNVKPADLPLYPIFSNTILKAFGWGAIDLTGGVQPDTLQFFETKTISNFECKGKNNNYLLLPTILCTATKIDQGVCSGDSGGPLVIGNTIHAIMSYVASGCGSGLADGHTRVLYYILWIHRRMKTL